jgi:hypothetical protein
MRPNNARAVHAPNSHDLSLAALPGVVGSSEFPVATIIKDPEHLRLPHDVTLLHLATLFKDGHLAGELKARYPNLVYKLDEMNLTPEDWENSLNGKDLQTPLFYRDHAENRNNKITTLAKILINSAEVLRVSPYELIRFCNIDYRKTAWSNNSERAQFGGGMLDVDHPPVLGISKMEIDRKLEEAGSYPEESEEKLAFLQTYDHPASRVFLRHPLLLHYIVSHAVSQSDLTEEAGEVLAPILIRESNAKHFSELLYTRQTNKAVKLLEELNVEERIIVNLPLYGSQLLPLHHAIVIEDVKLVRAILEAGKGEPIISHPSERTQEVYTAAGLACKALNIEIIGLLAEYRIIPTLEDLKNLINPYSFIEKKIMLSVLPPPSPADQGKNEEDAASSNREYNIHKFNFRCAEIIKTISEPDELVFKHNITLLHLAALFDKEEVFRDLARRSDKLSKSCDSEGYTAAYWSKLLKGSREGEFNPAPHKPPGALVKVLINTAEAFTEFSGVLTTPYTVLYHIYNSVSNSKLLSHIQIIEELRSKGHEPNEADGWGWTLWDYVADCDPGDQQQIFAKYHSKLSMKYNYNAAVEHQQQQRELLKFIVGDLRVSLDSELFPKTNLLHSLITSPYAFNLVQEVLQYLSPTLVNQLYLEKTPVVAAVEKGALGYALDLIKSSPYCLCPSTLETLTPLVKYTLEGYDVTGLQAIFRSLARIVGPNELDQTLERVVCASLNKVKGHVVPLEAITMAIAILDLKRANIPAFETFNTDEWGKLDADLSADITTIFNIVEGYIRVPLLRDMTAQDICNIFKASTSAAYEQNALMINKVTVVTSQADNHLSTLPADILKIIMSYLFQVAVSRVDYLIGLYEVHENNDSDVIRLTKMMSILIGEGPTSELTAPSSHKLADAFATDHIADPRATPRATEESPREIYQENGYWDAEND